MRFLTKLLMSFEYKSILEFSQSLVPSTRYQLSTAGMFCSALLVPVDKVIKVMFGIDELGFAAITLAFLLEVGTGLAASIIKKKEDPTSVKFSRFSLKAACYLILIAIPYMLGQSLLQANRGVIANIGGTALDWMSIFLILWITQENIISVLENLSVISGKDKTAWITVIKEKFKSILQ